MHKKNIQLSTPLSRIEIKNRLAASVKDRFTLFGLLNRNEYQGKINDNSFKFITRDSPPMEITGTFNENQVEFTITWDSLKRTLKGYIYAIGYTIITMVFLLIVTKHPQNFWVYLFGAISLTIPYFVYKYVTFFHYSEPKPEVVINHIKKSIKAT